MQKISPKVGVYIPSYNAGEKVIKSIESIINQTYDNFNITVINDGSEAKSADILRSYCQGKLIKIINHPINIGFGKTYQEIFEICTEDYLCIYHADDEYNENIINSSVAYLEKNKNAVIVFSETQNATLNIPKKYRNPSWYTTSYSYESIFIDIMRYYNFLLTPSACIRVSALKNPLLRFGREELRFKLRQKDSCGDLITWFELMKRGDVGIIPYPLMFWSKHSNQLSQAVKKNLQTESDFITTIDFYIKENKENFTIDYKSYSAYNFIRFKEYFVASINLYINKDFKNSNIYLIQAWKFLPFKYFIYSLDIYIVSKYTKWILLFILCNLLMKLKLKFIIKFIKRLTLSDY